MKTAVVCPVYNEGSVPLSVCVELCKTFDSVVIVDDGSDVPVPDPGQERITVLRSESNRGKGASLLEGFQHCLDHGASVIATIDGDGEHDPLAFGPALGTYRGQGMMNLSRAPFYDEYSRLRRARNILFSQLVSTALGKEFTDTQSGMRLFSADAAAYLVQHGDARGYAIETQSLFLLERAGFEITERNLHSIGPTRPGKRYASLGSLADDIRLFSWITIVGLLRSLTPPQRASRKLERFGRRRS